MVSDDKGLKNKPANMRILTLGDLTWVDVVQPVKASIDYLGQQFAFHPMDLDDSISVRQLSKIEEYPAYLFLIFHMPVYDKKTRISLRKQWSVFVGDKFLVTLHPEELKCLNDIFHDCEVNADTRREFMGHGSGYLLYHVLDGALDAYFPVLDKIMSLMENIEDIVFSEEVEASQELSILRRDIITQRRVMFPTRKLLTELENKLKRFSKIDLTIYYSDLMDHMNKICETLDESTEVIDVYKDADYLQSGYHANHGIRAVAVMLAVVLPMLVVFGLFDTYVSFSQGAVKGSPLAFFVLVGVVAVIVAGTLVYLRRKHLI